MKSMKEAFEEACLDEGVYCLYLTGDEARATLRALGQAGGGGDPDAAAAHARLQRRIEWQRSRHRTEEEDREARERLAPPYDLPDAEALQAFVAPARRKSRPNRT
ncbi:hypothetical protein AB0D11_02375 [Streptomyces monashensis]|uniref:hypothetical protein n=1 Tax=Streptomyces monashensis TaxID=1678012 RepID=UPI003411E5DD